MSVNPFVRVRAEALKAPTPQDQNRQWWEQLPMTYERWENEDRSTSRQRVVEMFLRMNPWLTRDYFACFAGKQVLEIGCGAGPASCLFAENGAHVRAIDLTETGVEMTRRHTTDLDVKVERMDAEQMSFADASFDHVFSWGVLHHTSNPERAFAEVVRVLRPGGTALIMVYNRASALYWIKGAIWLLLRGKLFKGYTFSTVQRFFTDGYFHRCFTPAELTVALAPLKVKRISMTGQRRPPIPRSVDDWWHRRWGFLLIAEAER